jgi:hypothetical protein
MAYKKLYARYIIVKCFIPRFKAQMAYKKLYAEANLADAKAILTDTDASTTAGSQDDNTQQFDSQVNASQQFESCPDRQPDDCDSDWPNNTWASCSAAGASQNPHPPPDAPLNPAPLKRHNASSTMGQPTKDVKEESVDLTGDD